MVKGICEKYNCLYDTTYADEQNIFTYTFIIPPAIQEVGDLIFS